MVDIAIDHYLETIEGGLYHRSQYGIIRLQRLLGRLVNRQSLSLV